MRLASLVRFASLVAWRRTLSDWRLQTAAAFGVVLAATLMAAGMIYSQVLEETALRYALRQASQEDANFTVRIFHALDRPAFLASQQFIRDRVEAPMGRYFTQQVLLVQTSTLYFTGLPGEPATDASRPRGALQSISRLDQNATLVEGHFPSLVQGRVEFVTDREGAVLLGLSPGGTFQAFSAVGTDPSKTVTLQLVGIIDPKDPGDRYWRIGSQQRRSQGPQPWASVALYTERESLFRELSAAIPAIPADFVWHFILDRESLPAQEAGRLRSALQGTIHDLQTNVPNSAWTTKLVQILDQHNALLVVARVPLFLVLFIAVGVLLYYLFLIAGFLGRLRTQEVALMRSRGASYGQAGVVIFLEGLIMAVPATLAGPFLAEALVFATVYLFPAAPTGEGLAVVGLSREAFLLAGAGALAAAIVFTFSTLGAARKGMVQFRTAVARPPEQPIILRYYLDVVLLGLLAMLWWQMRSRGTFLIRPVGDSELSLDVALLLGPMVGVLGVGLVILRVFPMLMKLLGKMMEPFGAPWVVQALRRLGRDPVPSASLLVLLTLATSLGVLSSTVIATLERSQHEQGLYEAGADFRVQQYLGTQVAAGQGLARALEGTPGVVLAAETFNLRTQAFTQTFGEDVVLFGVEPQQFAAVAWNREDLTGGPLSEALGALGEGANREGGVALPEDATHLGLWAYQGRRVPGGPVVSARLQDGRGWYFDIRLGQVTGQDWVYLEAPIQPSRGGSRLVAPSDIAPPYTLHTLWFGSDTGGGGGGAVGAVFLDQLQAVTPGGSQTVALFQDIGLWRPLEDPLAGGLYSLDLSEAVTREGRESALFIWGSGGLALRGIQAGPAEEPLPALASESFLDKAHVKVGDTLYTYAAGTQVPLVITGATPYFPSLNPNVLPFIVVDLDSVLRYVTLHVGRPLYPSLETWVRAGSGASPATFRAMAEALGDSQAKVVVGEAVVAERVSHPLLAAGWSGLLALSFLSVVLASASGLLLYTYIDAREQVGQLAILRTLGFTRIQVNSLVWFNLALTVASGALLGVLGGRLLSAAVLPLLAVAEGGARVTPPMVVQSDWNALLFSYVLLAGAMAVTIIALARAIARLEVQRLLRVAEA
ncbi:MAG: hypothetical protein HY532_08030 [Chloroflexi bacterium]|nr:hypothetical protein [Chloroflexota bacterium]